MWRTSVIILGIASLTRLCVASETPRHREFLHSAVEKWERGHPVQVFVLKTQPTNGFSMQQLFAVVKEKNRFEMKIKSGISGSGGRAVWYSFTNTEGDLLSYFPNTNKIVLTPLENVVLTKFASEVGIEDHGTEIIQRDDGGFKILVNLSVSGKLTTIASTYSSQGMLIQVESTTGNRRQKTDVYYISTNRLEAEKIVSQQFPDLTKFTKPNCLASFSKALTDEIMFDLININ